MHLVNQGTHFFPDARYIETGLLKGVTDGPFTPGSMNPCDDEAYPSSCKVGVKFPVRLGEAVLFVGEIIDSGRPNKTVSHLYAGKFVRFK